MFVDGMELGVDTIIYLLEKEIPEVKGLSMTTILRIITEMLGCKVMRKGKNRYNVMKHGCFMAFSCY